jgi:hypothetical protein
MLWHLPLFYLRFTQTINLKEVINEPEGKTEFAEATDGISVGWRPVEAGCHL